MSATSKPLSTATPSLAATLAPLRNPQVGAKAVGSFVPRLTRQAFEKFGFSAATLITDWVTIVGADIAAWTAPERLKWPRPAASCGDINEPDQGRPGATLVLRVDQGRALDIEYQRRQIMERINAYFGYRAVAELRIVQSPMAVGERPARIAPSAPAPCPTPPQAAILASVADEGVRGALERLAAGLAARRSAPRRSG
jgi:hypothetical protein